MKRNWKKSERQILKRRSKDRWSEYKIEVGNSSNGISHLNYRVSCWSIAFGTKFIAREPYYLKSLEQNVNRSIIIPLVSLFHVMRASAGALMCGVCVYSFILIFVLVCCHFYRITFFALLRFWLLITPPCERVYMCKTSAWELLLKSSRDIAFCTVSLCAACYYYYSSIGIREGSRKPLAIQIPYEPRVWANFYCHIIYFELCYTIIMIRQL